MFVYSTQAKLLPKVLMEAEDFSHNEGKISLVREEPVQARCIHYAAVVVVVVVVVVVGGGGGGGGGSLY